MRYRSYDANRLLQAYESVIKEKIPVKRAATLFSVPLTTLRDRVDARIDPKNFSNGGSPVFSKYEEEQLGKHLEKMASFGYGLSRSQTISLASEYAVSVGRRSSEKPLTKHWLYGFLSRWPNFKVVKPSSLSHYRAQSCTPETIEHYYSELKKLIDDIGLSDKPELIYNIDEKGVNCEHKPMQVLCKTDQKPQAVTSQRETVTLIAAGNAIGTCIPPFFVFKGRRMMPSLLNNVSSGTSGIVSRSGWSNTEVFKMYLANHFLKYVQGADDAQKLVLYDGHRSHIHPDIIEWAKQHNITLFVLPPHTSHILQPLDVGCFGPLEKFYNQESQKFMLDNREKVITWYEVASLVCKVYSKALSVPNLVSSFQKTGIYPFSVVPVPSEMTNPSKIFSRKVVDYSQGNIDAFLSEKDIEHDFQPPVPKKPRNTLSKIVGGQCITNDQVFEKIQNHLTSSKGKSGAKKGCKFQGLSKTHKPSKDRNTNESRPEKATCNSVANAVSTDLNEAGPSRYVVTDDEGSVDSQNHSEDDDDLCCVCKKHSPPGLHEELYSRVVLVKWAQCDKCSHWTHLRFCCQQNVVRRSSTFLCPCCNQEE